MLNLENHQVIYTIAFTNIVLVISNITLAYCLTMQYINNNYRVDDDDNNKNQDIVVAKARSGVSSEDDDNNSDDWNDASAIDSTQ